MNFGRTIIEKLVVQYVDFLYSRHAYSSPKLSIVYSILFPICRALQSKQRRKRRQNKMFVLDTDTITNIIKKVGPSLVEDINVYEEFNARFGQLY